MEVIFSPLLKTALAGLFSTKESQGAKLREETLLAGTEMVCVGNVPLAGCSTVTMAAWSNVAKRRSVGLSPWLAQTSGATNQNSVSTCACTRPSPLSKQAISTR